MRKVVCSALVLAVLTALCACGSISITAPSIAPTDDILLIMPAASAELPPVPSVTTSLVPVSSEAPTPSPTPSPTTAGPAMYSCYAYLKSFDPDTGVAKFDYFEILKGDDAVAFLVEEEGYAIGEAQTLVDNFADSEFVEKNTNPQLRSIDIDDVSLSLMYQPSGAQVPGSEPVPSTASDFRTIYAHDPSLLLDSFFYYIHVESDGHVSLVEQVYWA